MSNAMTATEFLNALADLLGSKDFTAACGDCGATIATRARGRRRCPACEVTHRKNYERVRQRTAYLRKTRIA